MCTEGSSCFKKKDIRWEQNLAVYSESRKTDREVQSFFANYFGLQAVSGAHLTLWTANAFQKACYHPIQLHVRRKNRPRLVQVFQLKENLRNNYSP